MWLSLLYLFHDYVAKNVIPHYKILFEAREAANHFFEVYGKSDTTIYTLTPPARSSVTSQQSTQTLETAFTMDLLPNSQLYGMQRYQDRVRTFYNWPRQMIPDKYALAQAGFYYTGQSDLTVCFACHLKVFQWERHDNPWSEHKRLSPNCNYIMMVGCCDSQSSE